MAEGVSEKALVLWTDRGLAPADLDGAWRVANMVVQAGMAPKGMTPQGVVVAAAMGAELGLNFLQSINSIAVINGRPSVWGDGALALVLGSGLLEDFQEWIDGDVAFCKAKRKWLPAATRCFSKDDAVKAGLWGKDIWRKYPNRMLQMRARSHCLRDLFADVLRGLIFVEEARDIEPDLAVVPEGPAVEAVDPFQPRGFGARNPNELPVEPTVVEAEGELVEQAGEPTEPESQPEPETKPDLAPSFKTRRRTKEQPSGAATCGITDETMESLRSLCDGAPGDAKDALLARLKGFFDGLQLRHADVTYLTEKEGKALLSLLHKPVPDKPNHDPVGQTELPLAPAEATTEEKPLVLCQDYAAGDEVTEEYCLTRCQRPGPSGCEEFRTAFLNKKAMEVFDV